MVTTIHAEAKNIKLFQQDSLQKILLNNKEQPFILIIWSISCSSCLAEMKMIQQIHQQKPKLNIIMLSVDGPEFHLQMSQILEQEKLIGIEQWGFAEDNAPGLRYVIDNRWYGELPRTYFFDSQHQKKGISGVLDYQQYNQYIEQIMPTN